MQRDRFVSAVDPSAQDALHDLDSRMGAFYTEGRYHAEWIRGINTGWTEGTHPAQVAMCGLIPHGASIVEVGCGDGASALELHRLARPGRYVGVDLNPDAWARHVGFDFRVGRADALPFESESVDVVLSMYVIEHLVWPNRFLDEALRILSPGGRLFIIAPDFSASPMASEWSGSTYGSGRDKLRRGAWADAARTAIATRFAIPRQRAQREKALRAGRVMFPILTNPRCLYTEGFVPDCDAVYPSDPKEIDVYCGLNHNIKFRRFYREEKRSTFGIEIIKSS